MKKYQQLQSISELKEGDIIRGKTDSETYVVHGIYGSRATAVRIADVTNPDEWEVYRNAEDEEFTLEFMDEEKSYRITMTGSIKRCDADLLFACEVENPDALMPRTEKSYWPLSKLDAIQGMIKPGTEAHVSPQWYEHSSLRVKGRSIEINEGRPSMIYLRLEPVK